MLFSEVAINLAFKENPDNVVFVQARLPLPKMHCLKMTHLHSIIVSFFFFFQLRKDNSLKGQV